MDHGRHTAGAGQVLLCFYQGVYPQKIRLNWLSVGEAAAVAVWGAHLQRAALLHISSVHAAWYTDHCGHAHVDK